MAQTIPSVPIPLGLKLTECLTPLMSFICMSRENHFHINGFALGLALKRRLGVTREKARLPADVWENKPAFLPLDTLLQEERSQGARKRSESTKPTVKCCSYTLFSRYVLAPFKTGYCPDVELQPFDHPNPLPCGRFCNSDSDCGLNNPLKCCASGCGTLCRHPGELFQDHRPGVDYTSNDLDQAQRQLQIAFSYGPYQSQMH